MRSPLLYIAWTHVGGRSAEIAASLGGEARNVYFPSLKSGWRVPLRYVLSAVVTVALLVRHRPRSVIVTNPPIFPAPIRTGGTIDRAEVRVGRGDEFGAIVGV